MNKNHRKLLLALALFLIGSAIAYLESIKSSIPTDLTNEVIQVGSPYAELVTPSGFINAEPFTLADYIGEKVILIDFWTYSCINCQRTTPYLNAWYKEYEEDGLLIVGIHSPEFEFEKERSNVESAVEELGITFPVVMDNEKATWSAYGNRYWPRKYLIDLSGTVIYDHIGEGNYEETEVAIQSALGLSENLTSETMVNQTDFDKILSPEIYFGSERANRINFTSIEPLSQSDNIAYLIGDWTQAEEYVTQESGTARLLFNYNAKNVYMVASFTNITDVDQVEVEVWLDGEFLKTIHVSKETLYPLVEGTDYGSHQLELIPKTPGLKLFTFTFG